jgi:cytochrome c-type biogenesis protein CcmH/NrfF
MTLMNNKKIAIISLFALLLIPPLSVSAAPADDIAGKFLCQCGGCELVVTECDHQGCGSADPMHNLVRDMAAEGQSEDAIIGYFVSTYGAQVLASSEQASPSGEDSGQIAGVAPFIAVLFAGVIIYYVLSKWAGRAKAKR